MNREAYFLKEYLLYSNLLRNLIRSTYAFVTFTEKGFKEEGREVYNRGGAYKFKGWKEFMETTAFPLNRRIYATVGQILSLPKIPDGDKPLQLRLLVRYWESLLRRNQLALEYASAEAKHEGMTLDEFRFTSTMNFPLGLDQFVCTRCKELYPQLFGFYKQLADEIEDLEIADESHVQVVSQEPVKFVSVAFTVSNKETEETKNV